jgi:hypothetical protein
MEGSMPVSYEHHPFTNWRKSEHSINNGSCIMVASGSGAIAVRDSKEVAGLILRYSADTWRSFLAAARISQ